jgi:hypothetical protein
MEKQPRFVVQTTGEWGWDVWFVIDQQSGKKVGKPYKSLFWALERAKKLNKEKA